MDHLKKKKNKTFSLNKQYDVRVYIATQKLEEQRISEKFRI